MNVRQQYQHRGHYEIKSFTLIQRFGGSLNLNIHFHQLFVDGCYELSNRNEPFDFWVATPPTVKEIEEVLTRIIHKITKYLERQKIIIKDDNDGGFQIPIPDEDTLSKPQATSVTYRFATGKSNGKKAIVLKSVTDTVHMATKGLVSKNSGFSLHAGVANKAHKRDKLEKICRYIARPAVSEERLSTDDYGYLITSLERTIVDAIILKKKFGNLGIEALKKALKEKRTTASKIMDMASKLDADELVLPYLQALT